MKKFYLLLIFLTVTIVSMAQADFRSNVATGDWNVAGSWTLISGIDGDAIPDADDNVFIQSGHTITLTADESCLDLHISTGITSASVGSEGVVALGANTLSLNGKLRCYFAVVNTTPGTTSNGGYAIYPFTGGTGKISAVGNSRNLTNSGEWGATITSTVSGAFNLEINLNAGQTLTLGTNFKCSDLHVIAGTLDLVATTMGIDLNNTSGIGDVTIDVGATITSSGSANNIFQRTANTPAGILTVNGTLILTGSSPNIQMTTDVFNGTVQYAGGGNQTFATRGNGTTPGIIPITYDGTVILSNSGTKTTIDNVTTTVNGKLSLQGTATMALGAGTAAMAYGAVGILEYAGSAVQTTGATPAEWPTVNPPASLTINNVGGVVLDATAGRTLTGTLTLTSGILTTTTLLTMDAGSAVVGASNASFVDGPIAKIGNTPFTFPVGKPNCGPSGTVQGLAFLAMSAPGNIADQFTAEYKRGDALALGSNVMPLGLNHISRCDYWVFNRDVGISTVDITLSWQEIINNCTTAAPYVNNTPSLVVAHFDGLIWDTYGVVGVNTGGTASGTVTWPPAQSLLFGIFTIGSVDFLNPLPISLNHFTGTRQNNKHLLNWKVTCNSVPSVNMDVERSADGVNFTSITNIYASALRCEQPFDYTDAAPLKGINYYRLKMTDSDGKISYSSRVALTNNSKGIDVMTIAPNPIVGGKFNVRINTATGTRAELLISDMQGRMLQKQTANIIAGFNNLPVNVQRLSAGTYQLMLITADGDRKLLRFVVQ